MNDRAALVEESLLRRDIEIGLPPLWSDQLDECHYVIQRLDNKIKELDTLHERNLQRPQAFSDSQQDNQQIEVLTNEISRVSMIDVFTMAVETQKLYELLLN